MVLLEEVVQRRAHRNAQFCQERTFDDHLADRDDVQVRSNPTVKPSYVPAAMRIVSPASAASMAS